MVDKRGHEEVEGAGRYVMDARLFRDSALRVTQAAEAIV